MSVKSRTFLIQKNFGIGDVMIDCVSLGESRIYNHFVGRQEVFSKGHPWRRKNAGDIGGDFLSRKVTHDPGNCSVFAASGTECANSILYSYRGPYFAQSEERLANYAAYIDPSSDNELDAAGTHAIAMCIPTNPLSGLGQFIGELRDIPKAPLASVWELKARQYKTNWKALAKQGLKGKTLADEFLNQNFGWLPFYNDVHNVVKTAVNHNKNANQYIRDSGKQIRRSATVLDETTNTSEGKYKSYGAPALATRVYVDAGNAERTHQIKRKVWFKGSFSYYLPEPDGLVNIVKRSERIANKLYGARIDPLLFYKLEPWSWLLDWVTTTGDVIHNWSAFTEDGLVMNYGYVMETKSHLITDSLNGLHFKNGAQVDTSQTTLVETKSRRRATPYGFGLQPSSFSTKQWAIIAALGISKKPRSLDV